MRYEQIFIVQQIDISYNWLVWHDSVSEMLIEVQLENFGQNFPIQFCKTFPQVTSSLVNGKDSENSHFLQVHCRCGLHQRSVRSQFNRELKFLDHHLTVFWAGDNKASFGLRRYQAAQAWSIRPVQASRGVSAAGWMVQGAREDLDWHRSSHRIFKYSKKILVPIMHISQRSLIKESFEWWHGVGVLLVANCEVAWGNVCRHHFRPSIHGCQTAKVLWCWDLVLYADANQGEEEENMEERRMNSWRVCAKDQNQS